MRLRTPPSGPEIRGTQIGQVLQWDGSTWVPADAVAPGAEGQYLRTEAGAVTWKDGVLTADTVASLDALPAIFAESVVLKGLSSATDGAGGLFSVTSGLTADAKDIIALPSHAQQLRRLTNWWAFGGVIPFGGGTTTIPAVNNAVPLVAAQFISLGGTDFTVDTATGLMTSTRRIPYRCKVNVQGALDVLGPGTSEDVLCYAIYNGNTLGTGGANVQPARAEAGRVVFSNDVLISAMSFGDTLQIGVVNKTNANDVALLNATVIFPRLLVERLDGPPGAAP